MEDLAEKTLNLAQKALHAICINPNLKKGHSYLPYLGEDGKLAIRGFPSKQEAQTALEQLPRENVIMMPFYIPRVEDPIQMY